MSDPGSDGQHGTVVVVSGAPGVGKSTVSDLVAGAFDRSVHLPVDDLMAWIVSGWIDPNLPDAEQQHEAIGAVLAVSAMQFAQHGYLTVVDGFLFPDGVTGLAAACDARGLACHYVVLTADFDTCWARASARGEGRWPLEHQSFAAVHARVDDLDLDERHVVDASGPAETVSGAVLSAFRSGRLVVTGANR